MRIANVEIVEMVIEESIETGRRLQEGVYTRLGGEVGNGQQKIRGEVEERHFVILFYFFFVFAFS